MILSDEIRRRQEEAAAEAAAKAAAEALVKGRAEGRAEGLYSVVKRMLKRGRSVQEIVDDTGVSEAEVRKLAGEQ